MQCLPRDDASGPEVLAVVPAELADEVRRLLVAVERDDPHALAGAVAPGAAVAELLAGGAPPRQQVVLAIPHVVALAAAAGGGATGSFGEAGGGPAADMGGLDLVEGAAREAGPAAEGGRPAAEWEEGWPVLKVLKLGLGPKEEWC